MGIQLTVANVLLSYDAPLVIKVWDGLQRTFVGINLEDADSGYRFIVARLETRDWMLLAAQRFDLRYALTDKKVGGYLVGETYAQPGDQFEATSFKGDQSLFLPDPGLFITDEQEHAARLQGVGPPDPQATDGKGNL